MRADFKPPAGARPYRRAMNFAARLPFAVLSIAAVAGCASNRSATVDAPATAHVVPAIPAPQIPDRAFNVRDFGTVADGATNDGPAIQRAIAACDRAGGGRVVVPAGTYFTGPIDLANHLELHLDAGTLLRFSDDPALYPVGAFASLPERHRPLIGADHLHDILISGAGTMDGQGQRWWDDFRPHKAEKGYAERRPKMLCLESCQRVGIEGVTLQNAPMFHMSPTRCENVVIDGVHVFAPAKSPNTDSCNPSGWNVVIRNCTFDVGDDNVAVKPFDRPGDGRLSVENVFIYDCTFRHGHGLSVGGQTPGGLRNLHVWHCTFDGTENGIRLKSVRGDGGVVEGVTFDDLTMTNVRSPLVITSYYMIKPDATRVDPPQPTTQRTPIWRDIRIAHVTATDADDAGQILGLPEMPVRGLTLEHVSIGARTPLTIANADGVTMRDVSVSLVSKFIPTSKPATSATTTTSATEPATTRAAE